MWKSLRTLPSIMTTRGIICSKKAALYGSIMKKSIGYLVGTFSSSLFAPPPSAVSSSSGVP
jgi:hypothetical protein